MIFAKVTCSISSFEGGGRVGGVAGVSGGGTRRRRTGGGVRRSSVISCSNLYGEEFRLN